MAKYSREQRDRAVDLYIKYERCAADVIRELGYPSRGSLWMWHKDRLEEERTGVPSRRGERHRRYSDEQKQAAVDHYLEYGRRLSRTMRMLGYPKSKELLMAWIDELAPGQRKLRHGPVPEELKRKAVVAVASGRLKSREAAAELGVEASVVRNWKRQMLAGSKETPVTKERKGKAGNGRAVARPVVPDSPTAAGGSGDAAGLADAVASLERRLAETRARLDELDADIERQRREKKELDIEIAIRKGALELLGKEPGAGPENLTNREKTLLVRTVSETLGVTARSLLGVVGIARSTYHYQLNAMKRPDKDASLLELVREAFENSERRYGYKRIHLELKGMGVRVSAKRIMRLMTGNGLVPLFKSAKRYSSYKGELTKAPANLVDRDFHAERPNMLWVTDLTEFSIPAGKAYLSPVIDCYDGLPVAWTIGTSPNAALANGMLADACSTLKDGEKPIIHSDRGCHYRWPEWIRICKEHDLTRSMSAKGCSPDNAAAEGFFGRLKQEFFHKRSFAGVSMDGFINMLDDYMVWYRDKRIKTEFGMSIMDRRRGLGFVA
ncbi:IS3 family transposase [Bifidobacterium adolescentis]|uniref:IS3 family transposase n=1 Tax=Bifidobacterium adolescentis TaxID=1680 RepID=UPI004062E494